MPERKGDASEKLENGTGIKHFYAVLFWLGDFCHRHDLSKRKKLLATMTDE